MKLKNPYDKLDKDKRKQVACLSSEADVTTIQSCFPGIGAISTTINLIIHSLANEIRHNNYTFADSGKIESLITAGCATLNPSGANERPRFDKPDVGRQASPTRSTVERASLNQPNSQDPNPPRKAGKAASK